MYLGLVRISKSVNPKKCMHVAYILVKNTSTRTTVKKIIKNQEHRQRGGMFFIPIPNDYRVYLVTSRGKILDVARKGVDYAFWLI